VRIIRQSLHILLDAFYRFDRDDGWAIASHIALSILMSVFPFLIVVTAIAAFIGSVKLADEVARLLLEAWPDEVAGPLATEIHHVLTTPHGGLVTIGGVFAVYFSSSGIESLRIGLNRAYGLRERRSFWVLRLESIGFVLLSAIALLLLAFLIVLGPLLFKAPRLMCRRSRRSSHITISCVSASAVSWSWYRCSSYTCGCRPDGADLAQCGRASWQRWCCG
jgi:membrane protein